MKKNYKMKKTISMKQFIVEFGENLSEHTKDRLLELGTRCILTRKFEDKNKLELKHVEHTKYDCGDTENESKKEYSYGQFIIEEGTLYFSDHSVENADVVQAPAISNIYNSLKTHDLYVDEAIMVKKVDDSNIDYIIDHILEICPEVSQSHLDIISKYTNI